LCLATRRNYPSPRLDEKRQRLGGREWLVFSYLIKLLVQKLGVEMAQRPVVDKNKTFRLDRGQIEVLDDKIAEILKAKSGRERLNMVWDAWTFFDKTIRAYLKNRHPEWTEEKIQREIVKRVTYGTK